MIAAAAIRDTAYNRKCIDKIIATRKTTQMSLRELGFTMPESSANFIFAKPPEGIDAETLYKNLQARGILVRYFKTAGINDRLRITIGTMRRWRSLSPLLRRRSRNAKNS